MEMESGRRKTSTRCRLLVVGIVVIIVAVVVGIVVWRVTSDSKSKVESSQPWKTLLLPQNVLPIHYDITLHPDFHGSGTMFYGNETIELNITSPTRFVLVHVHSDFMTVVNTAIKDKSMSKSISVQRSFIYKPNEFYVIETEEEMNGVVHVMLQFQGTLIKSLMGLYKSSYFDTVKNETKQLSASKFEPTYARRAFPCLDEPNLKAQFTITLVHKSVDIALSNMPVETANKPWYNGLVATKFQRSVKMSTYLVCFIVCDFEFINSTSGRGVPIRVFATPDKKNQTEYALEMAKHTLDKYEQVFGMHYPLPKLDLIAIPDFVSGAMEHWGLITFRESLLLFDSSKTPLVSKERVSAVVSHEMAHQWFGNIVTMDWWNDLWLNEGFASYMEYLGVSSKETEWDYNDEFLVYDTMRVQGPDALNSTHPIVVPVNNPDEITSVFDAISYSKGAAVIRMLETVMGNQNFFEGIKDYLHTYKWGNARTDNLWEALAKVDPRFKVKEIMDTWTTQDGYPYVNISISTSSLTNTTSVTAIQKRFLSDPTASFNSKNSPFEYKWYIPLDFVTTDGKKGTIIMDRNNTHCEGDFGLSRNLTNWIKFNQNKTGFYKVLYPEDMWNRFAEYLVSVPPDQWTLATGDRADLLADAFSFAESGFLSYDIPLTLACYLSQERKHVPWSVAVNYGMFYVTEMLVNTTDYALWKKFLTERVKPVIKHLGFEDKGSHIERRLRSLVMNQACKYGEESAQTSVKKMFRNWIDNGNSPSVNIRAAVYACGMAHCGTDDDWKVVWQRYQVESSPQEKDLLIYTLAQTPRPHLISRLLEEARRTDGGIKTQDFFTVVINVGNNVHGNHIAWDWVRKHYSEFEKRFTVNDRNFGRMVYRLVQKYNTDVKLNEVKTFFKEYPNEGASARYRKMAIENIEKNIHWMNIARTDVVNWLKNRTCARM